MSEWWSYSPGDLLMFSARTYHRLFERHNEALWPAQVVALLAGVAVVVLLARGRVPRAGQVAAGVLAAGWLTVAVGYFWVRYATIHLGGRWFAIAFAWEAGLLAVAGWRSPRWRDARIDDWRGRAGWALFAASVVVYPMVAMLGGRPWLQAEWFGLAPDPTAVGTLGLLTALRGQWWLWLVPLGWGVYSALTLWALRAPDFWGVAAALGLAVALSVTVRRRRDKAAD